VTAALDSFAAAARRYCEWCEGAPSSARVEARTAYDLLVTLLGSMRQVGSAEPVGVEIDYDRDFQRMRGRFASMPFQFYRSSQDPFDLDDASAAGVGDVSDDLADIWLDLERGLQFFDRGDRDAAAWHWVLMFESHWGRHATSAIHALHCWLVDAEEAP
jgi:hypothetical protein